MKTSYLLSLVAFGLAACPAWAKPITPAAYVASAGASDLYERTASETVLQTTQDPKVRDFANMMLTAHAESTVMVKAAAAKAKVTAAPPMLTPAQAEMVAQLKAQTGTARDAAYIAQQKVAHGQALNVQKAYAMEGTSVPLKAAAGKIVPVVEHHIAMLQAM